MEIKKTKYANVIMPLKFSDKVTYSIPSDLEEKIFIGSTVQVPLKGKNYPSVVEEIKDISDYDPKRVRPISAVDEHIPIVERDEIKFWREIAKYYMCSVGEVYKAASPYSLRVKRPKKSEEEKVRDIKTTPPYPLTDIQQNALEEIISLHKKNKTVLLNGITGSGKTEIYIHLINRCLDKGQNVLYLLPEVAVSRQLSHRLEKIFGEKLLVYHSRQTIAKRKEIIAELSSENSSRAPFLILGLRSALFLPIKNLGLIIVDEEHDSSYKQSDPSPRYNGRDAAMILAQIKGANVLLGSATPSYETIYNVESGKFAEVVLNERYYSSQEPDVEIVDMIKERKKRAIKGSFSKILLKEIEERLNNKEQTIIFRSRRAYSPLVQCSECGEIPKCTHCNINLTYHKFNNTLSCHYCGFSIKLHPPHSAERGESEEKVVGKCPSCSAEALLPLGAGTEKLEEELGILFPTAIIARFDADTARNKSEEEKILKEFAKGKIDILVGTQMITKGFDFGNLTLTAIISAESLLAVNDFRGDEKGIRLLTQLKGRSGRREKKGKLIIQTSQPDHPIFNNAGTPALLEERKEFDYPPFLRLIEITIKDRYKERLSTRCKEVEEIICSAGITNYLGPIAPPIDRTQGEYISLFRIKLNRNAKLSYIKKLLLNKTERLEGEIIIDVDPV